MQRYDNSEDVKKPNVTIKVSDTDSPISETPNQVMRRGINWIAAEGCREEGIFISPILPLYLSDA